MLSVKSVAKRDILNILTDLSNRMVSAGLIAFSSCAGSPDKWNLQSDELVEFSSVCLLRVGHHAVTSLTFSCVITRLCWC